MNSASLRQKYLSLVARLYELAAEFTDSELRAMREDLIPGDDRGVDRAIDGLMLLHGVVALENEKSSPKAMVRGTGKTSSTKPKRSDSLNKESLEELLADRGMFPTVQDIAKVVSGSLPPQPKEGRSRYIKRVVKYVEEIDESSRNRFRANLSDELGKRPHTFVSDWKNLIREL